MTRSPFRRCTKADPRFGLVCACGNRKAKQAFTCQPCHNVARGYGTVPAREQNRRWRQRYFGFVGAVGDEDAGLIFQAAELETARAQAGGELAVLVAEQAKDQRTYRIGARGMLSLDAVTDGRTLHERVA